MPISLFAALACAHRIAPLAPASLDAAPAAEAGVRACWVEFSRSGAFTASGVLIHHPRGLALVDAGQSLAFRDELDEVEAGRFYLRLVPGALVPDLPAADVLRANGVDPAAIVAFLPTHAHSDHVGGLMDLPPIPVGLAPAELALIRAVAAGGAESFNVIPAEARRIVDQGVALDLADQPWATFPSHADLFGDRTVVVVPLAGHTPGSVGVVVDTGDVRLLNAGDAVNTRSQLTRLRGKSWLLARTDVDRERADAVVAQLAALQDADPSLFVLPAHERDAWVALFGEPGGCVGDP